MHERLHLGLRHVDDAGDLLVREVGELGQHERGALVLGQLGDVAEQGAQVRPLLDGGAEAVDGRLGVLGGHGLGPAGREHREAAVAGDRVQPWAHLVRAAARDQRPVRAQEGLLEGVLGFLGGAEHVPAEAQQRTVVAVVEGLEGALVAARGECRQPDVVHPGEPETGKLGNSECGGRHLEVITHIPDDPPMERRLASWKDNQRRAARRRPTRRSGPAGERRPDCGSCPRRPALR